MSDINKINFDKPGGIGPAVIWDAGTNRVLMLGGYESGGLSENQRKRQSLFFGRSKNRLPPKGETWGNYLWVDKIKLDGYGDAF